MSTSKGKNCIYCGSKLKKPYYAEHVILNALGGKKKNKQIVCRACGDEFGNTIDKNLSEQFTLIANQLGIKTQSRSRSAPAIRGLDSGKGYQVNLLPGGKPAKAKSEVDRKRVSPKEEAITINAKNPNEALKLLYQQLSNLGINRGDINVQSIEHHFEYTDLQTFKFQIGGKEHLRCIAKMMLNLFAIKTDYVLNPAFNTIRKYIRKGLEPESYWVNHDYVNQFPSPAKLRFPSGIAHTLMVFGIPQNKISFGLLELYGHLKFSALLSDKYDGPEIAYGYSVDPVEGVHKESEIKPLILSKDQVLFHKADIESIQRAGNRLMKKIERSHSEKAIEELIQDAIDKTLIGKGEVVTEEMVKNLSHEISRNFTRLMFRIDHTETITLEEMIKLGTDKKKTKK